MTEYTKLPHDFIKDLKKAVSSGLPTSSYIVGEVIKTIYDETSNASDLADIIERDPPLTAKILKVANSAYYGASKKVNSLQRAVVTLGFATIKELVTTMAIVHSFFQDDTHSGIDRSGLWLHSIGVAKAAQLIADKSALSRPDICYTIGLLHDIGKIVVALTYPKEYSKVVGYAAENNCRIIQAERAILNIDHCMIGNILCRIWDLPDELGSAILYHHDPLEMPDTNTTLANIVHMGDMLARNMGIGNPGDPFGMDPVSGAFNILGSTPEQRKTVFKMLKKAFAEEKEEIDNLFSGIR